MCKTQPIVFKFRIRFTMSFMSHLLDLLNSLTINFVTELEGRLRIALRLRRNAIVVVIKFTPGSIITDFMVLYPSNTTENTATVRAHLVDEIYNNATNSLQVYYPIPAGDPAVTLLEIDGR